MFQYDISAATSYATKKESEEAYRAFILSIGEDISSYPFSLDGLNQYKGKPTRFKVASWGGYYNADNQWTLFVSYRCTHPAHTIQHTWFWDEANQSCINHRVMEFIN